MDLFLTLMLLSLSCPIHCYPCDGCICNRWMNTLSCISRNGTDMSKLEDTSWIGHIDILDTEIQDVRNISSWPNLYSVDIRGNGKLHCADILKMQVELNCLLIITDCDDSLYPLPEKLSKHKNGTPHMNWALLGEAIIIPPLLLVAIFYLRKMMSMYRHADHRQTIESSDNAEGLSGV